MVAGRSVQWCLLPPSFPGAIGEFLVAVEELLQSEADCERFVSRPGVQIKSADERKLRRSIGQFGDEVCHVLQEEALQEVECLGSDALQKMHVYLGCSPCKDAMVRISQSWWLGEDLTLPEDLEFMRKGWRLSGGLALGSIAPDIAPVPEAKHSDVVLLLRALARSTRRPWLSFQVPLKDALVHGMLELQAWSSRLLLAREEELKGLRWSAQARMQESVHREQIRLAAKGFDCRRSTRLLQPAHLEKKVHWSEYRDVERMRRMQQRRRRSASAA